MSPEAITWVDATKGVGDGVQAAAILVGGAWAYFKFARGRTFAYRGQLAVTGELVREEGACGLLAHVRFENTGAAQIQLSDTVKVLRAYATTGPQWRAGRNVNWGEQLILAQIFTAHGWVEAQEPIDEDVLIPVPEEMDGAAVLAYRVECVLGSRRRRGRAMKWTAQTLVLGALEAAEAATGARERKEGETDERPRPHRAGAAVGSRGA